MKPEQVKELMARWLGIFHQMSSEHFGNHQAEDIANTYRICAQELERAEREAAGQGGATFQAKVREWTLACFGRAIADDKVERNHRFLEESLELVQVLDCTQSEAYQLVDYVYGSPAGKASQECGGVLVTLMALCNANGLNAEPCGSDELARVWQKIEQIRAKQAAKPKHSPLSIAAPRPEASTQELRELLAEARKYVRGRHSTLTYGPKDLLDRIDAALAAQPEQEKK